MQLMASAQSAPALVASSTPTSCSSIRASKSFRCRASWSSAAAWWCFAPVPPAILRRQKRVQGSHFAHLKAGEEGADDAARRLAETLPTTVAGAAELIDYVIADSDGLLSVDHWHNQALINAALALRPAAAAM